MKKADLEQIWDVILDIIYISIFDIDNINKHKYNYFIYQEIVIRCQNRRLKITILTVKWNKSISIFIMHFIWNLFFGFKA